jgi:hypothetical protein
LCKSSNGGSHRKAPTSKRRDLANNSQRCGHPGQQHGLRMPPCNLPMLTSMRRLLVSSFLADVTQQIHSFRASGVILVQRRSAVASDSIAFRGSAGSLCTVPCTSFREVICLTAPLTPNWKSHLKRRNIKRPGAHNENGAPKDAASLL